MAQLMPLPLTVSCSSKIQIGFTFLVPAHLGSPGKEAVKWLLLLLAIPYDHMIMYVGLFGHYAVVFYVFSHVFMFYSCQSVQLTYLLVSYHCDSVAVGSEGGELQGD